MQQTCHAQMLRQFIEEGAGPAHRWCGKGQRTHSPTSIGNPETRCGFHGRQLRSVWRGRSEDVIGFGKEIK